MAPMSNDLGLDTAVSTAALALTAAAGACLLLLPLCAIAASVPAKTTNKSRFRNMFCLFVLICLGYFAIWGTGKCIAKPPACKHPVCLSADRQTLYSLAFCKPLLLFAKFRRSRDRRSKSRSFQRSNGDIFALVLSISYCRQTTYADFRSEIPIYPSPTPIHPN